MRRGSIECLTKPRSLRVLEQLGLVKRDPREHEPQLARSYAAFVHVDLIDSDLGTTARMPSMDCRSVMSELRRGP